MNYIVNREQTLLLQREIAELKSENAILKKVISDYQDGLINANKEIQRRLYFEEKQQIESEIQPYEKKKIGIPLQKLTNAERQLLFILLAEKDKSISRENLSKKMWGKSASNSCMARLSTIIKKLRLKLHIDQGKQEVIRTNWGEGYQLTEEFFEYYEIDHQLLQEYEIA
ncbi:winged helix-turn-helix domain-containing protein [Enterococcus sp. AZ196]|uniref:winged helix-turn-helix domain-containing protein n=1 Tax=Enterococcus sp. AZ196 TaxID=2774659 RepID=UPI003D26A8ED